MRKTATLAAALMLALSAFASAAEPAPATAPASTRPDPAKDIVLSTNIDKTDVNLFLPANTPVIRMILINPADKNAGPGGAWSETLRNLGGAQMGLMIENVDKRSNRPTIVHKVIDASLKEFAEKSGRPELVNAPLLFGGFSKGGGWAASEGQARSSRSIGFLNACGGVGDPDKDLSMGAIVIIGGISDGFHFLDAIPKNYEPARKKGAPWTLALNWGCAHDYGNSTALAMPLFDALARLRMPKDADPTKGPVKLNDLKLEDGWLGDRSTWESNYATIARYADYKGDKDAASWLPNKYTAYVWRSFESKDPPVQITIEGLKDDGTAAEGVKLVPFDPKAKRTLMVPPGMRLKLGVTLRNPADVKNLKYWDGDAVIAEATPGKSEVIMKNVPAGPRAIYVEYELADGQKGVSNPALVIVNGAVK